jgi:hypothetical protein
LRGRGNPTLAKAVIETLEDRRYLSVTATSSAPANEQVILWFDHGTMAWTETPTGAVVTSKTSAGKSTAASSGPSTSTAATSTPISQTSTSQADPFAPPFDTNLDADTVSVTSSPVSTASVDPSAPSAPTDSTSPTAPDQSTTAPTESTTPAPPASSAPSVVTVSTVGSVALPSLSYIAPASNPTLPDGMNVFTPPGGGQAAAAGAPILGAYDESAGPDQSIALTGSQFTTGSGAAADSDTQFVVYGQTNSTNGEVTAASLEDLTASGATVTIDASEPANSMYVVWAINGDGASTPVAINQTQAWWIGAAGQTTQINSDGTQAISTTVGQTMSVYGQNLTNGAATPQSWVYLQSTTGGQSFWANVTAANPYKVDFNVDTPGTYQVWVNNGLGGQYSWSEVTQNGPNGPTPQLLTVNAAASTWSNDPASIINVKNYGALGNGTGDDGPAILNAIKALQPGDTLYLPAGTYMISGGEELRLPSNIRVMGDGIGQTTLDFVGPINRTVYDYDVWFAIGWWDHGASNVEMDSLTLEHTGATNNPVMVLARDGQNIAFNDVQIIGNSSAALNVDGSVNVSVQNSTIQGSDGAGWLWVQDGFINNTTFQLAYGAQAALNAGGSSETSITNCTIGDADDSDTADSDGTGQGRFIEYNMDYGQTYYQYVSGNSTDFSSPTPGNMGEQINIEGQNQSISGAPTAVSGNTLTFSGSELPNNGASSSDQTLWTGDVVIINSGPGVGEMRRISAVSYQNKSNGSIASVTVTLESAFNVTPNSTSNIYLGTTTDDTVIYQNAFSDQTGPDGAANLQAATGTSVYGGSYDLIYDGNTDANLNAGFYITSAGTSNPSYFIQVINNTMTNVGGGIGLAGLSAADPAINYVGVVARDNTIAANNDGVTLADPWLTTGSDTLAIIEDNAITAPVGVTVYDDPDTLIRKNTFTAASNATTPTQAPQAIAYENSIAPAVRLSDNTYQGFAGTQTYVNIVPTEPAFQPVLQAPYHVIDVTASAGSSASFALPIWNDGPTNLTWTATTGASWLALSAASGVIGSESNATAAMLVADTAGLNPGKYQSTVTLSYDVAGTATSQIYTVDLTVQ